MVLASRGLRESDEGGYKKQEDDAFERAARKQARAVWMQTFVATAVLSAVAWFI